MEMQDYPCSKRQNENYKGEVRHRCINPEAEPYKQLVVIQQCAACPVRAVRKKQESKVKEDPFAVFNLEKLPDATKMEGYPVCPFRHQGHNALMCAITGLPVNQEICHRCDSETRYHQDKDHEASATDKIANYFGAIRRWVASGKPTRTQEEIDRIFNEHCSGCEKYDKEKHACKSCGCKLSTKGTPLGNKLAMATEVCPLGRW